LEQSVELSKRLLASAKHVGVFLNLFRRGGSEKRKVGVLFSGGIDAVAVLVALRAWGVPCVAAVAGFTGGVEYVLGLSQILTKQCFISNAPVTVCPYIAQHGTDTFLFQSGSSFRTCLFHSFQVKRKP
jgi:predicted PP-loop superfamily ATPase